MVAPLSDIRVFLVLLNKLTLVIFTYASVSFLKLRLIFAANRVNVMSAVLRGWSSTFSTITSPLLPVITKGTVSGALISSAITSINLLRVVMDDNVGVNVLVSF